MTTPDPVRPRLWHLLFALGVATLVYLSLFSDYMPPYKRLYGQWTLDNLLHLIAFALLGVVAPLAFRTRSKAMAALMCLLLLGISLELLQEFIPNRRCQLTDALGNAVGLLAGGAAGFFFRSRREPADSRQ